MNKKERGKPWSLLDPTPAELMWKELIRVIETLAGAIHHLAETIQWRGEPDEDEPRVCSECREAMKNRTQ